MTQILVRDLSESVKTLLKERAKRNGHSMEEEARNILSAAVATEADKPGLGTRIASHFKKHGFKDGEIQEVRGFWSQPATFDD